MSNIKIIEKRHSRGQYDMPCTDALIERDGQRIYITEGFGGLDSIGGGAYRFAHGLAVAVHPTDTLDSLDAVEDGMSIRHRMVNGYDDARPLLDANAARLAKQAGLIG